MLRMLIRSVEESLVSFYINRTHVNAIFFQSVRWKRKPLWLPTAKSKLFRVNERKKLPLEEAEELKRLFNNYRTEMKSIRKFFAEQMNETTFKSDSASLSVEDEEEELKKCFEVNEKWNAEVRKLREITLAKQKEIELEEILKNIEEVKINMDRKKQEVEELVRKEKERAKYYITAENIDEAIDKALMNVVDYNYAVDLEGNYYYGRNTKPPKPVKPSVSEDKEEPSAVASVV